MLADTYLIAWRKLEHVPDGHQGRLWLFGVARNLLLKGAHRRRAHDVLIQRLGSELQVMLSAGAPLDDHRADSLRKAVVTLPDKEREILLLTAWEGLTPREIAAVTGACGYGVWQPVIAKHSTATPMIDRSIVLTPLA